MVLSSCADRRTRSAISGCQNHCSRKKGRTLARELAQGPPAPPQINWQWSTAGGLVYALDYSPTGQIKSSALVGFSRNVTLTPPLSLPISITTDMPLSINDPLGAAICKHKSRRVWKHRLERCVTTKIRAIAYPQPLTLNPQPSTPNHQAQVIAFPQPSTPNSQSLNPSNRIP
jgi:hypothetical protein